MSTPIPFHKTYVPASFLEDLPALLTGQRLEGGGQNNRDCEALLSKLLNDTPTLLTASCTSALEAGVALSGIGPGDEVLLPSFTFVASASAVTRVGAKPIFVDIAPDTLCLDPEKLEQAITKHTKAIIPVHYDGFSCDMDKITDLATTYGITVIEDAAQALLTQYKNRPLGTIGDFGCFSFHDSKVFSAGEGGALTINKADQVDKAIIWRDKGTNRQDFLNRKVSKYEWVAQGTNACMSEISALFLKSQLEERSHILTKRKKLFETYQSALSPLQEFGVKVAQIPEWNSGGGYHFFYLLTSQQKEAISLIAFLEEKGIQAVQHYPVLHRTQQAQKFRDYKDTDFQNALHVADCIVRLPLFTELSMQDQSVVIDTVLDFYKS